MILVFFFFGLFESLRLPITGVVVGSELVINTNMLANLE